MNRADRRFQQRIRRPSGQFVGELSRRADQAAYGRALRTALEQEANGAPIPGEIAERMTKEKPDEILWQVMVTDREKGLMPMGPMMNQDACGMMCEAVNKQIARGLRRDWTKAEAYPMTPISQGVI